MTSQRRRARRSQISPPFSRWPLLTKLLTQHLLKLESAGSSLENLVKTSVFLVDLADFQAMNEVYASRVGDRPPARSTFQVAKLPSGALVEIEAIAHL